MPRKISAISLCTALFAIMVLITSAAPVVAADCSPPNSFTVNGTVITLEDVSPEEYDGKQFYRYNYRVDGKKPSYNYRVHGKKPSQFNIAIPVCCGDPITLEDLNVNAVYPPGEGEPTNDWLRGYYQAFVARITPNPDTGYYSFLASTRTIGETSVCLKVKNKLMCGAIQGPACYQPALSGEKLNVTFGGEDWEFVAIDKSQCLYEVYKNGILIEGTSIASIVLKEGNEPEPATIVTSPGECIVWAQFGENSTRCPIIRGKKYCR